GQAVPASADPLRLLRNRRRRPTETPTPEPVEVRAATGPEALWSRARARRSPAWVVASAALVLGLVTAFWQALGADVPAVASRWSAALLQHLSAHAGAAWQAMTLLHREAGPEPGAPPAAPRADAHLRRDTYESVPGGIVFFPHTFASADGGYDLYIHF